MGFLKNAFPAHLDPVHPHIRVKSMFTTRVELMLLDDDASLLSTGIFKLRWCKRNPRSILENVTARRARGVTTSSYYRHECNGIVYFLVVI